MLNKFAKKLPKVFKILLADTKPCVLPDKKYFFANIWQFFIDYISWLTILNW